MTVPNPRALVIFLLLGLLCASVAGAQSASVPPQLKAAGIVTAVTGRASLARPTAPAPSPLKFKDDLFVRDKISTAEESVVRVLLGGKALVTIRELSVFTVTEAAGTASVDLTRGKLGLAVARSRMRKGEAIEVRTPNAVAAVRGTILIVDVKPAQTADASGGPAAFQSEFYVLKGLVEVQGMEEIARPTASRDGARARVAVAAAPSVMLQAMQSVRVTGATFGAVQSISPAQAVQLGGVLKVAAPHQDSPPETKQQIAKSQQAKGGALAQLLSPERGGATGEQTQETIAETQQESGKGQSEQQSEKQQLGQPQGEGGGTAVASATSGSTASSVLSGGVDPGLAAATAPLTAPSGGLGGGTGGISAAITTVPTGVTGGGSSVVQAPVVGTTQQTTTTTQALEQVVGTLIIGGVTTFDTPTSLPTLTQSGGEVTGSALLTIPGAFTWTGGLQSGTGETLLQGQATIGGPGVTLDTRTMTYEGSPGVLAGPLTLTNAATFANTGTFSLPNDSDILGTGLLTNSGTLTKAGAGTLTIIESAVTNTGTIAVQSGTLQLNGGGSYFGNLTADSGLTFGGGTHNLNAGVSLTGAGTVQVIGPGAVVNLNVGGLDRLTGTLSVASGSLTVNGDLVALGNGESLSPAGTMVAVSGGALATIGAASDLAHLSGAGSLNSAGPILAVSGGTATLGGTVANLTGSTLTTAAGVNLVSVTGGALLLGSSPLNLTSPTSTASIGGDVLNISGGTVTGPPVGALINVAAGALNVTGEAVDVGGTGALNLSGSITTVSGGVATVGGGLRTTGGSLNVGTATPLFAVSGGATLNSGFALNLTNTSLNLAGQTVTALSGGSTLNVTGGPAFQMTGGALNARTLTAMTGATPNTINRTGPLFDLTNATVTLQSISEFSPATDRISVSLGAGQANIRMTDSNVTLTGVGEALSALGGLNMAPLTHAGVALIATNTGGAQETINVAGPLLVLVNGVTLTDTGAQVQLTNMTVTQTGGTSSLVQVVGPAPISMAGGLFQATTSVLNPISGQALATLNNSSAFTVGGHLFDLTGTNVDLTFGALPDQPLVRLLGNNQLTLGGSFLKMNGGTLTVNSLGLGDGTSNLAINANSPFVDLTNATVITTSPIDGGVHNVTTTATLTAGLPVVRMDNSTFTMSAGDLSLEIGLGSTFGTSTGALALVMTNNSILTQNQGGLVRFEGGGAATAANQFALVQLTNSTLNLNDPLPVSLVEVQGAGTTGTVNGPLVVATNSAIAIPSDTLLIVNNGTVLNTANATAGALFQFTGGSLSTGADFIALHGGGTLNLNNPNLMLFSSTNTALTYETLPFLGGRVFPVFALDAAATLTSAVTAPLISINGGSLAPGAPGASGGGDLLQVGESGLPAASLTTSGPLLSLQNILAGNFTVGSGTLFTVTGGSTLSVGGPFLDMTNTVLALTGPVLLMQGGSTATNTAGPRIRLTNSSLTARALARFEGIGNVQNFTGSLLDLTNSTLTVQLLGEVIGSVTATRTLSAGQPFIRLANSTITLTNPTAFAFATLAAFNNAGGTLLTQAGAAIAATGPAGTINLTDTSLAVLSGGIGGIRLTDTASSFIQLANTTVTQTGAEGALVEVSNSVTALSTAPLISLSVATMNSLATTTPSALLGNSGNVTLSGPLLDANGSTISLSGAILGMAGGTLTATGTGPFINLTGGTLNLELRAAVLSAGSTVNLSGLSGPFFKASGTVINPGLTTNLPFIELNPTAVAAATLTVGGSLMDLTNVNLNLTFGPGAADDQAVLRVSGGSQVAVTSGPTIRMNGGSLVADALIKSDGQANSFTFTGTLLDLSNNASLTVRVGRDVPIVDTDVFTAVLAANQPFSQLTNATLNVPGEDVGLHPGSDVASPFSGRVLAATNSTVTFGENLFLSFEGGVASSTTNTLALVSLVNSTVNLNGLLIEAPFSALFAGTQGTVGGPLLSMNGASVLNITNGTLLEVNVGATLNIPGSNHIAQFLDGASRINLTHALACAGDCQPLPNTTFLVKVTAGSTYQVLDPLFQPFVVADGTLDTEIVINNGVGDRILVLVNGNSTLTLGSTQTGLPLNILAGTTVTENAIRTFTSALHETTGTLTGTGTVTVTGPYTWQGGTMSGAGITNANGGLTLNGNENRTLTGTRALIVGGNTIWSNGAAGTGQILFNGGTLNNTGLWQDQNAFANDFVNVGGTNGFSNAGQYQKTGAGMTTINVPFVNTTDSFLGTALVDVQNGTLRLAGGGRNTALISVAGGATLEFSAGAFDGRGGNVDGAGSVLISGATVQADDTGTVGADFQGVFRISAGSLSFTGDFQGNVPGTTLSLTGSAFVGTGGTTTITGALVRASTNAAGAGGVVIPAGGAPVMSVSNGTYNLATTAGESAFHVSGVRTTNQAINLGATLGTVNLDLGSDRPLRGPTGSLSSSLVETAGTTTAIVIGPATGAIRGKVIHVDTALLEATLPFLNLTGGTTLTVHATPAVIDLLNRAQMTSGANVAAFRINASTMTVTVGDLIRVAGGSFLNVLGDLLRLSNGAILNLQDPSGFALRVTGNSVVDVAGALVEFTGTTSRVRSANTSTPTVVNGVPISFTGGATAAQVEITGTPIRNPGLGVIETLAGGAFLGSLINVEGTAARVRVRGN